MRSPGADRGLTALQVGLAVVDAAGRLALPIAVLGLARGDGDAALVAASVACVCAAARGALAARAIERALVAAWIDATDAACGRSVQSLPRRREDDGSVAVLLDGLHEQASFEAQLVPQVAGLGVAGLATAVLSVIVLGPGTTAAGAALLAVLGLIGLALGRGLRAAQLAVWEGFGRSARELRLLVEGAVELRATGRERDVADRAVAIGRGIAENQARASAASARVALLPAALAVLAIAGPSRAGVDVVVRALGGPRLFEASILGAAAIAVALAAARVAEEMTSTQPRRARFRAFVAAGRRPGDAPHTPPPSGSLAEVPIAFEGFGHAWSADGQLTPAALDLALPPRAGVALVGPNGSGKTTAALALLGVVAPTAGAVTIDGRPAHRVDRRGLGSRIGYVPQDPLLVPGESIGWHCRLHEEDDVADDEVDRALDRVGLLAILTSRARARGLAPRDVPAGELSGGERRRLALARAILRPRELYVLDEPEAALDAAARHALAGLLEELAASARIVLIAHDSTAIPPGFTIVRLTRPGGDASEDDDAGGPARAAVASSPSPRGEPAPSDP